MVAVVEERIRTWGSKVVMMIEDSNHLTTTVYTNLELYARFVTDDSFIVVQDTKLSRSWYVDANASPAARKAGPSGAIEAFLATERGMDFVVDRRFEYYISSEHAAGFLRRTKGGPKSL